MKLCMEPRKSVSHSVAWLPAIVRTARHPVRYRSEGLHRTQGATLSTSWVGSGKV